MARTRILHIITGLEQGGAERILTLLAAGSHGPEFEHQVISMTDRGVYADQLIARGVQVHVLGMRGARDLPRILPQALRIARAYRPDILQTWLHSADLLGWLMIKANLGSRLIWTLRCSDLTVAELPPRNLFLTRILARLSKRPDCVIANSTAGKIAHHDVGYRPKRWEIVPNGFDLDRFAPSDSAHAAARAAWGIAEGAPVFGFVGRDNPVKRIEDFVAAAGLLHDQHPDAHFVLAGTGLTAENTQLQAQIAALGISEQTHLIGPQPDVPMIMNGFDMLTNCSSSEGFANVVGEAMSCGVPCVVTDVGDNAMVVGTTGQVIQVANPSEMAAAWAAFLAKPQAARQAQSAAARQRIVEEFSLARMQDRFHQIYTELSGPARS